MRIWLWDVANHHGVTDDEDRAIRHAERCMHDGDVARVELAVLADAYRRMSTDYIRTGAGWTGTCVGGTVSWDLLPTDPRAVISHEIAGRPSWVSH